MDWTEFFKAAFKFLEKPTSKGVLAMGFICLLLAYSLPIFVVTGAFVYVGDKVAAYVGQRFDRIERILERREIAKK